MMTCPAREADESLEDPDLREEEQQGEPDHDRRNHEGRHEERHQGFPAAEPVSIDDDGGEHSDRHRNRGRADRQQDRRSQSAQEVAVREEVLVPAKRQRRRRERPQVPASVERHRPRDEKGQHQKHDREPGQDRQQRHRHPIDPVLHRPPPVLTAISEWRWPRRDRRPAGKPPASRSRSRSRWGSSRSR